MLPAHLQHELVAGVPQAAACQHARLRQLVRLRHLHMHVMMMRCVVGLTILNRRPCDRGASQSQRSPRPRVARRASAVHSNQSGAYQE